MRIGIDMDNTICSTRKLLDEYVNIYKNTNKLKDEQLWNDDDNKNKFLNKYLERIFVNAEIKDNCADVLNKLRDGNTLYIITARSNFYVPNILNVIYEYLERHSIVVDYVLINAGDKVDDCIENNIDVMIEDNYYNYTQLSNNGIKTILLDERKEYLDAENRAENWNDIYELLIKIK